MADGSSEERTGPKQLNELTFSAPDKGHGDTEKCSGETFGGDSVKLSFYGELETSVSCEKSYTSGVVANRAAVGGTYSRNSSDVSVVNGDDRKKRCIDRYDSSESSDSGVAVLSPTESGGSSGSDITEPRSPRSPESLSSCGEERMPPWASEPAPAARRLATQPASQSAPSRKLLPQPPPPRRITEYFNHKMKPQNNLKRDDDTKKKCLPKNGVTHDLEKYISYLSQTLSPKVLMDVGKDTRKNGIVDAAKPTDLTKMSNSSYANGIADLSRHGTGSSLQEKHPLLNGLLDGKKPCFDTKSPSDPSANGKISKTNTEALKRKIAIPTSSETLGLRAATSTSSKHSPKKLMAAKTTTSKINGVVSSTTKLDSRMNGVTCGSNNLSLNPITHKPMPVRKETAKKTTQPTKRTNRKSSACIANSKNLTWSKANNLKQVQMQKQNCTNLSQNSQTSNVPGEAHTAPKMNMPNGVRQVSMTVNGNLSNINVPLTNLQNCHQINISQQCNGAMTSNNMPSFVAVPHAGNVMLTALRIPQNGLPAQTLNQPNNMAAFNRTNVNVSSPTKLNGQFVFPLMQNINGTVLQIPSLMAKMPNFVLPQTTQLTAQRQDHLQNQQPASFLINTTLLKLANTYPNVNKSTPVTSQPVPTMNKNVTGMQAVGMTVPSKPNYAVNFSHPMLVPQPGYIVTSVPNMNVKETWSYTHTNSSPCAQTSCSNTLMHHPSPVVGSYSQALHTSSIPLAPVKPPDNPIQGTDPPSSTVKEPELTELTTPKCDVPWLSKTVNNNIVPLEPNIFTSRPFAQVSSLSEKLEELAAEKAKVSRLSEKIQEFADEKVRKETLGAMKDLELVRKDASDAELRKVEEVARREETIFTQITVLKDVSSDVHNTVIEANFCGATTESESGIGTDKSIDSPSDSQTSKECDEDSSLSLSVSICSMDVQSQKSPILKQPKTLRFPPRNLKTSSDKRTSSTDTTPSVSVCLWENCMKEFEGDPDLLDHLQAVHVETQAGKENFVCLWQRCKVRGKPSCSRLWLERHTLSHGGNKPFKCIVDGCERRFSTQILLERHVNNHFNEVSPNSNGSKKSADSSAKLIRRNGKKLRYRRQPWSARRFDFFDAGMMEGLAWRLSRCTRWRLGGSCPLREPAGRHTLTLHAALTATRYNAVEDRTEALLTYYPPNVLEDEWVPEKDVKRTKRVEIAQLPTHTKVILFEQFCSSYRKSPSPPPAPTPKAPAPAPAPAAPARLMPARHCTSSRLLNNLIAKQKKSIERNDCNATNLPMVYKEEDKTGRVDVSGAKKRKIGRRYGGNAFWPCGR